MMISSVHCKSFLKNSFPLFGFHGGSLSKSLETQAFNIKNLSNSTFAKNETNLGSILRHRQNVAYKNVKEIDPGKTSREQWSLYHQRIPRNILAEKFFNSSKVLLELKNFFIENETNTIASIEKFIYRDEKKLLKTMDRDALDLVIERLNTLKGFNEIVELFDQIEDFPIQPSVDSVKRFIYANLYSDYRNIFLLENLLETMETDFQSDGEVIFLKGVFHGVKSKIATDLNDMFESGSLNEDVIESYRRTFSDCKGDMSHDILNNIEAESLNALNYFKKCTQLCDEKLLQEKFPIDCFVNSLLERAKLPE